MADRQPTAAEQAQIDADTMTDAELAAEMNAPIRPRSEPPNPYDTMPALEEGELAPPGTVAMSDVQADLPTELSVSSQPPAVALTPEQQRQVVLSQTSPGGLTPQEQAELVRRWGQPSVPKGIRQSTLGTQRAPDPAIMREAASAVVPPPPAAEESAAVQSAQAPKESQQAPQDTAPTLEQLMTQNALTPSVKEQQESLNVQMETARKAIADKSALEMADQELSKFMASEQLRKEKMEAEIKAMDDAINNQVRAKSFAEIMANGSFGQKFLAGLAVLAGGISTAYTGEKVNPALAMIDKEVERQAEKDKLNFEQKSALRSQLYAAGQNIIKASQERFQNDVTQQKLQLAYDELADKMRIEAQKRTQSLQDNYATDLLLQSQLQPTIALQGSPEEIAAIKANNDKINAAFRVYMQQDSKKAQDLLEKRITLPNGMLVVSPAPIGQVNKFSEARSDIEGGLRIVDRIKDAALKGNMLDPRDRGQIQSDLTKLTGQLRLTYLGPGAMTQQEYDRLYAAIGDPSKIFTLSAIELAKLQAVRDNLEADLAERAKSVAGVPWPLSKRAQIVYQFRQRGHSPRIASEKAEAVLQKIK